ncbi:MAG: hypothetical protein QXU09_03865 [Thermoproteota archaeon]
MSSQLLSHLSPSQAVRRAVFEPDGSKQYVWAKTTGLPTLQQDSQRAGTFIVNNDATITGYYRTQKTPRIPPAGKCKTKRK